MAENKSRSERQIQILEAALELFVENGYHATTMNDIKLRTGLSKGALYHHYQSKKALFLALIDYWEDHSFPDFASLQTDRCAADTLRDFARLVIDTFHQKKYVFLAELEFWSLSNHDIEIRRRTRTLYARLLELFENVIQGGIRYGEFRNLNPRVCAIAVLTSLQGVIWFTIFEQQDLTVDEYLNDVMTFIIAGFKTQT